MKKLIKILSINIFFLSLFTSQIGFAAKLSGYVDFDDLSKAYGEPKVEINLGATMIGFVSNMSKQEDPAVAEMLSKLESVKIRVYNTKGDAGSAEKTVNNVTKRIKKDNWLPIVSVNEENEKVRIYMKQTNGIMDGLVVMTVKGGFKEGESEGEAVFINIVGEIDPKNIQKVTDSLSGSLGV